MDKLYNSNLTGPLHHTSAVEVTYIGINREDNGSSAGTYAVGPVADRFAEMGFPLKNTYKLAGKGLFDIMVSFLLIITILSWLLPVLALLIKLDSRGPVFFLQKRTGKEGKPFLCIKLRSMIVNEHANLLAALENDWRITRFGQFLRCHHLDELPQLFNVFIGNMSMVGPRPHMLNENLEHEKLISEYTRRHRVKPGITGLAQSLGNFGATHNLQILQERVAYDLLYIQTWSFGNDLRILFRTLQMVLGVKKNI